MQTGFLCQRLLTGVFAVLAWLCGTTAFALEAPGPVVAADRGSALADGWQHGAFIEIFVRGYKDSNGDGIGDLRGLTQSLDYLHDLGIRGIWLMPVTRSQDHDHGYAVSDYRDIEPDYGTLADFDELLKQAHARGIGVIMDYVINHSAVTNPLFVEASSSTSNRYRDWYVWRDPAPTGWKIFDKNPWNETAHGSYLGQFSKTMPDFNMFNPQVHAFHQDNLRFWLNRGVDGFRFDAVGHLVENGPDAWSDQPGDRVLMNMFRKLVMSYANRYMVCEAPANPEAYGAANVCGGSFAVSGGQAIIEAVRGNSKTIGVLANYFSTAPAGMATMLSNHDFYAGDRPWNQFRGNQDQYRLAAATYLLLPGTPFIYYGEEIGMSTAKGVQGDASLRIPMSWSAERGTAGFTSGKPFRPIASNADRQNVQDQLARPDSLLAYYTSLLALRNSYPSIARGSYESPQAEGKALSFRRRLGDETTVVLINYGAKPASLRLAGLDPAQHLAAVFPATASGELTIATDGSATADIGAQSVFVYSSKPLH